MGGVIVWHFKLYRNLVCTGERLTAKGHEPSLPLPRGISRLAAASSSFREGLAPALLKKLHAFFSGLLGAYPSHSQAPEGITNAKEMEPTQ